MLISCTTLCNAMNNYKNQNKKTKEDYLLDNNNQNVNLDKSSELEYLYILFFSILLFVLEFLLLFYAIYIALTCAQTGPEKIVHLILALTFTIPYLLFMVSLNPCATNSLRGLSLNNNK